MSGIPAITSTPWLSPRDSTRATTDVPARSVTSGSWVCSSSVWTETTGSTAYRMARRGR